MPMYEVRHTCPLSTDQKDALAMAITELHSKRFTTPKLFVNVKFTDASNHDTYVGGRVRKHNSIVGNVRQGPTRTQQDWDDLCKDLHKAWSRIVHPGQDTPPDELDMRAIFILGGLIAASEAGFTVAPAGQDQKWAKENMAAFKAKAAAGDEDFVQLVADLEGRSEFGAMNGH